MIAAIWIATISREYILVRVQFYPENLDFNTVLAGYFSHYFVSLFVICVSCACIFIKVRCSRHRHHHGAASLRERKLTTTLLIITLLSLLSWLPFPIFFHDFIYCSFRLLERISSLCHDRANFIFGQLAS